MFRYVPRGPETVYAATWMPEVDSAGGAVREWIDDNGAGSRVTNSGSLIVRADGHGENAYVRPGQVLALGDNGFQVWELDRFLDTYRYEAK